MKQMRPRGLSKTQEPRLGGATAGVCHQAKEYLPMQGKAYVRRVGGRPGSSLDACATQRVLERDNSVADKQVIVIIVRVPSLSATHGVHHSADGSCCRLSWSHHLHHVIQCPSPDSVSHQTCSDHNACVSITPKDPPL